MRLRLSIASVAGAWKCFRLLPMPLGLVAHQLPLASTPHHASVPLFLSFAYSLLTVPHPIYIIPTPCARYSSTGGRTPNMLAQVISTCADGVGHVGFPSADYVGSSNTHWGQSPVSGPGTSQIHCKDMDKVLAPIPVGLCWLHWKFSLLVYL